MASGRLVTWLKMTVVGAAVCVGGPAFVMWIQPTDEELFQRYNPELQKKSLERRHERQKEFDDFVTQLKEYSKSDKPIWTVQEDAMRKRKEEMLRQDFKNAEEGKARQEALRKEAGLSTKAEEPKSTESQS
ncbi:CBP4-domain-containing protein [Xylaria intraflava]|nr:CBP4-domain-containing protein [Xylaria intraflava]